MNVFCVDPRLTIGDREDARVFFETCVREMELHIPIVRLLSRAVVSASHPGQNDLVLLLNGTEDTVAPEVIELQERAAEVGTGFLPVAIDSPVRKPIGIASRVQSLDVVEELRRRRLNTAQVQTVAAAFARTVIARVQPTLSKEHMRLFVSHRRLDGEELAYAFWEEARKRAIAGGGVFRDLSDLKCGVDNDEKILEELEQSDAVVFLDTPKAGESEWIMRELEVALGLNLPVVWVRLGPADGRVPLSVAPGARPHFDLPDADVSQGVIDPEFVDRVLHQSFDLAYESALRVFDSVRRLEQLARSGLASATLLDRRRMVYEVRLPRLGRRYPQRPLTHLVQFFGRRPGAEDESAFGPAVCGFGYDPHPHHGAQYDAAVLAGPIPPHGTTPKARGRKELPCYVDSAHEYVSELEFLTQPPPAVRRRGVIISGAFPDTEPEHEQHLKDAVYSFVRAIYDRGGTVIFGGHPTFEPMILHIARARRPNDYAEKTRLYLSTFFADQAKINVVRGDATVFPQPAVDQDRGRSLSAMRKAMIQDQEAVAFVAIGGREPSDCRLPGVDEEMAMACSVRIPVFLIGSAGGRTATLASQMQADGWEPAINSLTPSENNELLLSYDYGVLANMVLASAGI